MFRDEEKQDGVEKNQEVTDSSNCQQFQLPRKMKIVVKFTKTLITRYKAY